MVTPLTCAFDNFPDSPGSGRKHGRLIQAHATHINYVEAVHVLGRGHCIADGALINVVCQKIKTSYSQDNQISNMLFKSTDEFVKVHKCCLFKHICSHSTEA